MIVDGEPCDIGGRVFKYSFEEACTELKKRSIPGEFETINKLAAVIRGHPDFSVRYDSVLFNPYGYNSSSGWVVLVVKVGGLFDIIDLFEGKTYEVSFDTAVDYLQKLMCLGPLADSVRIKHTFFCGVKCCAYPQFLIIGREKIVAAGDQYRLNGKTYIYSFEQFKRLVGEQ
jgi:hypothetical protein